MPPKKRKFGSPEKIVALVCMCADQDCVKEISNSSKVLNCMTCKALVLAECLKMDDTIYDYIRSSPNVVFVCEQCKTAAYGEAVPVSREVEKLNMKVDRLLSVLCPPPADPDAEEDKPELECSCGECDGCANGGPCDDKEKFLNEWKLTKVRKERRKPKSFAEVASSNLISGHLAKQAPIASTMAESMYQTMKEDQRLEKEKRTLVVENLRMSSPEGYRRAAVALLSELVPNVTVEGILRERRLEQKFVGALAMPATLNQHDPQF